MPNKIHFTNEYYATSSTGKYIRAFKKDPGSDLDEWEVVVCNEERKPIREYSGWDEVRVLSFMEFFESGDD